MFESQKAFQPKLGVNPIPVNTYRCTATNDTSQFLFNPDMDCDSEITVQRTYVHNMQGTAMGNGCFTVLKATSGTESSVGANEISDSWCRHDKFFFLCGRNGGSDDAGCRQPVLLHFFSSVRTWRQAFESVTTYRPSNFYIKFHSPKIT